MCKIKMKYNNFYFEIDQLLEGTWEAETACLFIK
jgi:hypothetical protein